MRPFRRAPFLLACAAVLAAAGCAGDADDAAAPAAPRLSGGDRSAATEAAEGYLAALKDGDGESGCAAIAPDGQASLKLQAMGSDQPAECVPGFEVYAERLPGIADAEVGKVTAGTAMDEENPVAEIALDYPKAPADGALSALVFWKHGDAWLIRTVDAPIGAR